MPTQAKGSELTTLRGSRRSTVVFSLSAIFALQYSYRGNCTATWQTPINEGSSPLHATVSRFTAYAISIIQISKLVLR